MVQCITGGRSLPGPMLDQIVAKADGVPLYLEELTKVVLESGLLEDGPTDGGWPARLHLWRSGHAPYCH